VVEHITERLLKGSLPSGERLPPERVLAEQYGVSRTVIREAVRVLASKGLLESRGGSGTYVRSPNADAIVESMSLLLRLHQGNTEIDHTMIYEVRSVLEVEIAALAARRATDEDIAALQTSLANQRQSRHDRHAYSAHDVAFHLALAAATRNALFAVLLNSMSDVMQDIRLVGFQVPGALDNGLMHHERILAAVQAHDPRAARKAMQQHLHDSQRILLEGLQLPAGTAPAPAGK
jgi:GntR family transcriptional repressor for pyruvate dehydrogenase complex